MLLNPPIMALLAASTAISLTIVIASFFAVQIIVKWNITWGSESQILLEKKTYLISTLVTFAFVLEILSLLLYVFTTDYLTPHFTGAMCAVGVLNVNPFGFPTLILKIVIFFLASVWLVFNFIDNQAYDYPLIRKKYLILLFIVPFVIAETVVQTRYFLEMTPNVITSCCGSLFSTEGESVSSELASLPPVPSMIVLYAVLTSTIIIGILYLYKQKGAYLFSLLSTASFLFTIASIISFLSLYLYEHPHHHCPFCILKEEYHYQGYWLYLPLFIATSLGLSVGALEPFKTVPSLRAVVPGYTRRFTLLSIFLIAFQLLFITKIILFSHLILIETYLFSTFVILAQAGIHLTIITML